MPDHSPTRRRDPTPAPFYVAYLPVPLPIRRFLRLAVPATLWALVVVAVVMARSHPDPGNARWDTVTARTFTGVLDAHPYPVLHADVLPDGAPGPILLVELGKRGSSQRAAPFHAARVRATGWLLRRDNRLMLELSPEHNALALLHSAPGQASIPSPTRLGTVTLRGEIVDAKCFLGAMKPGHGKTHKECATLCIRSGLPPMLVTRDASGSPTCYLLLDPSGGPMPDTLHALIADPVELTGQLELIGGLPRIRVDPAGVQRIH